jgi:hypothetical protein
MVHEFGQVGLRFLKSDDRHAELSEVTKSSRAFYQTVGHRLDHCGIVRPVTQVGEDSRLDVLDPRATF